MPPDPRKDVPNEPSAPGAGPSPALVAALRRMLGPLVRLLLDHQISFPALSGLLKEVYIEQASRHFKVSDRPQTISRLHLLTGIHRKDVKRLQQSATDSKATAENASLGAQLVRRWTADPEYRGDGAHPRALPRLAGSNLEPSFERLVESVTQDIRPRAILDEWLRLGIATLDDEDRVHLVEEAFVPTYGFEEKAHFFGRNLHDHLAAARHNLESDDTPMLERSVYYAGLRPESVEELERLSRELGMEAIQRINRRAHELQQADEDSEDARQRMHFGVYFFRAAREEEDAEDPDAV